MIESAEFDLETDVRRQIRTTPDLSALVGELGFDLDFAAIP